MLSLMLILGGLLVVATVAQMVILATDWLYVDDNSWLIISLGILSIIGLAIQALITGIFSTALIALLPSLLFIALQIYDKRAKYDTKNPIKIAWFVMRDSWLNSKLIARLKTYWSEGVWTNIKKKFNESRNNYLEKRSSKEGETGEVLATADA